MRTPNHATFGVILVVDGIVLGTEPIVGYPLIGTGVLLSIIGAIKSRRIERALDQKPSVEDR